MARGGGLFQLIAYGSQDPYLNFTVKFRIHYVKHDIKKIIIDFEFISIQFTNFNLQNIPNYYQ